MKPRDQFGLDALLGRWPAQDPQEKGGKSWEERAEAIVSASLALKDNGSSEVVTALLAPPQLPAEPGEEKSGSFQFDDGAAERDERVHRPQPQRGGEAQPMSSDQPKRPSLKELAARASQTGAAKSTSTPLPPSVHSSAPPPAHSSAPPPATVTPIAIAKAKAARTSDPGREDSGVLKLADMQAKEAEKAEAAAVAAEAALASVATKRADTPQPAPVIALPAAAKREKSSTGLWAGVTIAVVGMAAAFAVYKSQKPAQTPTAATVQAPAASQTEAPVAVEAPKPEVSAQPAPVASADPAPVTSGAPKPEVAKAADDKGAESAPPPATAVANNDAKPATPDKPELKGSVVGTLDDEMKKAVGQNGDLPKAPQDDGATPALAGSSLPEQPSQGNAQAAIRAVMGGAKACVAGASDPTSASVTFGSSGAVQGVNVTGWAAENGKAACVKSALQGAKVSPFAKPSFTVPVTVRP